jgi:hypothetical protein
MSSVLLLSNYEFTYSQISLVVFGVALLFIVFSAFWGLIRGIKKTTFRGAWLIVTALVLFFVTPLVTRFIFTLNISALNLKIDEIQIITLKQAVEDFISSNADLSGFSSQTPFIVNAITTLPQLILNVIIFVVLFWILKIILWPIWAIIAATVIKKKNIKGEKLKKYHLAGMLVGIVLGLFIGSLTLMPVLNIISLAAKIENETVDLNTENIIGADDDSTNDVEGGIISRITDEDIANFILSFDDSYASQLYKYTGFGLLNKAMFNGLTTVSLNKESINLEKDILNGIKAFKIFENLKDVNFNDLSTLTEAKINDILSYADELVDVVFEINTVKALGNQFMPFVLQEMVTNPNFVVYYQTNYRKMKILI